MEASAYDPFGKEIEYYENILEGDNFHCPFGFGGYKKTVKKDIYRTLAREYNGDTGRFQTGDSEMYIHPYVPVSANLYQYAWNSPLKYADPMGRDVEESEWDRYVELGLTGYVKYGYHQIVDYMPDELMLISGATNPLVLTGSIEEAKFNRKWTKLDSLLIKNNRAYTHGFTEGFWDFSLGKMEGMVDSVSDDAYSMYSYVDDVYNGRNTDNWLMMCSKFIKIPMKYVYSNPLDDFMNPPDEDVEKAKKVAEVGKRMLHMNPVELAEAALRGGVATYNHYNEVFHSEEGVAQLFYNGGYGVGAVTGVATDFIVTDAVAQELTQIGGEIGGKLKGLRNMEGGSDTSFTWKLRGEDVTLNDVNVQDISYIKRSSTELQTLRSEFNTTARRAFLEDLGQNAEYLRNAGFSEADILKIQAGRVPDGWQVHHKLPLDDSGTNSFENLVLIQNEPYHKVITNYQNSVARQMEIGDVQTVQWPMPNGDIYPKKH